jgi:L-2-hydroxyglutarate oxidase
MPDYDVAIIGGGIYGCSIAKKLAEQTKLEICLLDRESHLASHQSGRNSGTLHPGLALDYNPGTQHAHFGIEGMRKLKRYCNENDLPLRDCGLLLVATNDQEANQLDKIEDRAQKNGISITRLESKSEIHKHEPNIQAKEALYTPESATVDSQYIVYDLAKKAQNNGVDFYLEYDVSDINANTDMLEIQTSKGTLTTKFLVNAGGSWAVQIAKKMGLAENYGVLPLRGEYYELNFDQKDLINSNVYPVSSPDIEGLVDIHFTRRPDGKVIIGPTGRLTSGFDSYDQRNVKIGELLETVTSRHFWKYMSSPSRWKTVWAEINKSFSKQKFTQSAQRIFPTLSSENMSRSYCGITGHLLDRSGNELHGFVFERSNRSIHLLQVHPGLTASLSGGEFVANEVCERIDG